MAVASALFPDLQRQQLQQQAPKVDVFVVAADVCNKAAMERAVKEHVSRCATATVVAVMNSAFLAEEQTVARALLGFLDSLLPAWPRPIAGALPATMSPATSNMHHAAATAAD